MMRERNLQLYSSFFEFYAVVRPLFWNLKFLNNCHIALCDETNFVFSNLHSDRFFNSPLKLFRCWNFARLILRVQCQRESAAIEKG